MVRLTSMVHCLERIRPAFAAGHSALDPVLAPFPATTSSPLRTGYSLGLGLVGLAARLVS